jgi:hypothetical protein
MPVADQDDLAGYGVAAQLSSLLGAVPQKTTGVGTTQSGAATLISRMTELNPASSNTAFVIPTDAKIMNPYFVNNQQATTALVFVPSGHTLNSVANASVSVAQYASAIIWQYKVKNWTYK